MNRDKGISQRDPALAAIPTHHGFAPCVLGPLAVAAVLLLSGTASAYFPPPHLPDADKAQPRPIFRLDGRFVHNVGRLHLQVTNIGQTGNAANPTRTTVPSAEYP